MTQFTETDNYKTSQTIIENFKGALYSLFRSGFHYTTNATTTTQKQSDYKVEQSPFTLIALF